jgi:NTE family protein
MRASYALPGIFKPVHLDGRWLFDGALVNPVPVSVARALGARYVIAVNVNADQSGRGSLAPIPHGARPAAESTGTPIALLPEPAPQESEPGSSMLVRNGRALKKMLQRQVFGAPAAGPGISTVMMEAFNIVQDRIARSRLAGDPPDAVIAPRTATYGLFDFHRADDLIAAGEAAAHRMLDDIVRELAARRTSAPSRSAVA